jgi:hypothetical protein
MTTKRLLHGLLHGFPSWPIGGLLIVSLAGPVQAAAPQTITSQVTVPQVTVPQVTVPHRQEIYVPAGLVLYSSPSRLTVGVGGGLGYRYDLDEIWTVYTEGRTSYFSGSIGTLAAGITGQFSVGSWNPQFGIGAMLFFGDSIRVVGASGDVPSRAAFAITTRISPLRFVRGRFSGSALSVDVGCGIDTAARCGLALSVALLDVGVRF